MPLIQTTGAASSRGFGQFARTGTAVYIEDVFSTFLYTGNGSTQTITNGIDLSGKGGLVWLKMRSTSQNHYLTDSARGLQQQLSTNTTAAQSALDTFTFLSNGVTIPSSFSTSPETYASWTFREQPKFFDVVTYTGSANSSQVINHNLASVPGCIIAKRTDSTGDWYVLHRSVGSAGGSNAYGVLNSTDAWVNPGLAWAGAAPTATQFSVESNLDINGATYVAYLFAHDAGGFGASGTDNVISCGSFTTDGSGNATVTLGYEPQWVLMKSAASVVSWVILDNMRGWPNGSGSSFKSMTLQPNSSAAEAAGTIGADNLGSPNATGFTVQGVNASDPMIYIAIRRGPMRTPTSGTSVFNALTRTGTGAAVNITGVGFPPDLVANKGRSITGTDNLWTDRLRGATKYVLTNSTNAEGTNAQMVTALGQDGVSWGNDDGNFNTYTYVNWFFRRAPGFFDVVCYTGTGSATTFSHNLGIAPELMIVKRRNNTGDWWVYDAATGNTKYQVLNSTATPTTSSTAWNNTTPTSSVFSVGTGTPVNASAGTYVAYLFATVAGVSKVGSYTGTGTTLQVNCGFTAGSRFVLIKRTDSTGDWYVWDSARGIVAGNDPYLLLNSTAAEVTSTDYVDTLSSGFEISSTAPAAINANGGTFVFLAVA